MSQSYYSRLPDLVIADGDTDSNALLGVENFNDAVGILVYSPAGLNETVTFQVAPDNELDRQGIPVTPTTWYDLLDESGNAIGVPAAGKAQVFQLPVYGGSLRLHSSSAVAADRTFIVSKIFTTSGPC